MEAQSLLSTADVPPAPHHGGGANHLESTTAAITLGHNLVATGSTGGPEQGRASASGAAEPAAAAAAPHPVHARLAALSGVGGGAGAGGSVGGSPRVGAALAVAGSGGSVGSLQGLLAMSASQQNLHHQGNGPGSAAAAAALQVEGSAGSVLGSRLSSVAMGSGGAGGGGGGGAAGGFPWAELAKGRLPFRGADASRRGSADVPLRVSGGGCGGGGGGGGGGGAPGGSVSSGSGTGAAGARGGGAARAGGAAAATPAGAGGGVDGDGGADAAAAAAAGDAAAAGGEGGTALRRRSVGGGAGVGGSGSLGPAGSGWSAGVGMGVGGSLSKLSAARSGPPQSEGEAQLLQEVTLWMSRATQVRTCVGGVCGRLDVVERAGIKGRGRARDVVPRLRWARVCDFCWVRVPCLCLGLRCAGGAAGRRGERGGAGRRAAGTRARGGGGRGKDRKRARGQRALGGFAAAPHQPAARFGASAARHHTRDRRLPCWRRRWPPATIARPTCRCVVSLLRRGLTWQAMPRQERQERQHWCSNGALATAERGDRRGGTASSYCARQGPGAASSRLRRRYRGLALGLEEKRSPCATSSA